MADEFLFLTELLGLKVYDLKGRRLGLVKDAVLVPLIHPSRIDRFLVGGGWAWLTVRHDQIRSISLDGIYLKDEQLTPYHSDEYMLRMVRDLLDQQIIDAQGRKVVRVTDVTFRLQHENGNGDVLNILDIDIGLRSMLRRLAQGVIPRPWIRRIQTIIAPHSIRWENCSILESDPQRRLRLNVSNRLLERMHPADLADIVEDLSPDDREAIFETIDSEVAAETLSEMEPDVQASILESLETEKAADIMEEMSPHEAADALAELEERTSENILGEMEPEPKGEVEELLEYSENSAGGLMNTEYVALPENTTVAGAMDALRVHEEILENLNTLFLVDSNDQLKAAVPLARLFTAAGATPLQELAADPLLHVDVDERQDRITELFDKYNLLTLPVIDAEGKLAGVITADEVISLLREK
ncbi:MAG TPA: CBS domain-containing protein [Bryobacteraceae bacterium]|nr:CBS domain-containing protein [Bryobacteraceae bacterium]